MYPKITGIAKNAISVYLFATYRTWGLFKHVYGFEDDVTLPSATNITYCIINKCFKTHTANFKEKGGKKKKFINT